MAYGQKDEAPADNKLKMGLAALAVIAALALAIWSGFRALDTRPRVTGVLGDGPPPRSTGASPVEPAPMRGK